MSQLLALLVLLIAAGCNAKPGGIKKGNLGISGGQSVSAEQFPYQAQIESNEQYYCAGSLIADNWILTAADCIAAVPSAAGVTVRVGSAIRGEGESYQAKNLYAFNKYNSVSMSYDVGLIELEKKINFSSTVQPVTITDEEIMEGEMAVISGFGQEDYDNYYDTPVYTVKLQGLRIAIVSRTLCQMAYAGYVVDNSNICAGLNGEGMCLGDFGDPLVQNGVQVGIASHQKQCGSGGLPGVFTNIAETSVRDWIYRTTGI